MIAKIIPRKHGSGSFRDSVNYNLGLSRNDKDKVEYVNTLDIFEPSMAIQEMEALALENTRSADPVFNCILSWRENEMPSHEQVDEAVQIVLNELGLEGCQVHYALHRNTENLHMHICVNRIDPETYKARDPAHGWTKKALEKAARKIELAQGWEIERSGRYVVTEDGEIHEKTDGRWDRTKLSQTARDIEAHTAEKSAERIAHETAAPIIREAKSWEELHKMLAEQGIAFDRKGSGAILRVGDTIVKASQAGRDISLSKLERRLGTFRERDCDILPRSPEPVE
ncbi:MAG: relaxase/mobilization nuclease domain-containing protein, partial [Synergistaceae bacterium]|nr:relaxase/mobilization nuclease domain-containing protein [Synergistaceae bacterium]